MPPISSSNQQIILQAIEQSYIIFFDRKNITYYKLSDIQVATAPIEIKLAFIRTIQNLLMRGTILFDFNNAGKGNIKTIEYSENGYKDGGPSVTTIYANPRPNGTFSSGLYGLDLFLKTIVFKSTPDKGIVIALLREYKGFENKNYLSAKLNGTKNTFEYFINKFAPEQMPSNFSPDQSDSVFRVPAPIIRHSDVPVRKTVKRSSLSSLTTDLQARIKAKSDKHIKIETDIIAIFNKTKKKDTREAKIDIMNKEITKLISFLSAKPFKSSIKVIIYNQNDIDNIIKGVIKKIDNSLSVLPVVKKQKISNSKMGGDKKIIRKIRKILTDSNGKLFIKYNKNIIIYLK
jgi:hypothetical protein